MKAGDVHEVSDCDSDRTMVEGSVIDSDFEEDELNVNRLIFINSSDAIPTAVSRVSEEELPSPEIQLICRVSQQWKHSAIKKMLVDQELDGVSESPERNLLTGAIISASKTPSNNAKHLRMLEEVVEQNVSAHSKACCQAPEPHDGTNRKIAVAVNDTDTAVRLVNGIRRKTSAQNQAASEEGEINVNDLLKPLSDSESPRDLMQIKNLVMSEKNITSVDESPVENGDVLPTELITVINALADTTPDFVITMPASSQGGGTGVNATDTGSYKPKLSHSSTDDDSTQITPVEFNMFTLERNEQLHPLEYPQSTDKHKAQVLTNWDKHDMVMSSDQTAPRKQESSKNSTDMVNNSYMKTSEQGSFCLESTTRQREGSSKCSPPIVKRKITCHSDESYGHTSNGKNKEGKENVELVHNSSHLCAEDNETQTTWLRRSIRKNKSSSCNWTSVNAEPNVHCLKASTINKKNMLGETKLHKAVMKDNLSLVHALIMAGANVNDQDHAGWAPLHEASLAGYCSITKELLEGGADANLKGLEQETPIRDAVREGHYEVAELLLQYGADPLLKGANGKCALDEAGDERMENLLLHYVPKSKRKTLEGKHSINNQNLEKTTGRANHIISAEKVLNSSWTDQTFTDDDCLVPKENQDSTNQISVGGPSVNMRCANILKNRGSLKAYHEYSTNNELSPVEKNSYVGEHPKQDINIILSVQNGSSVPVLNRPQGQTVNMCDKTSHFNARAYNPDSAEVVPYSNGTSRSSALHQYVSEEYSQIRQKFRTPSILNETNLENEHRKKDLNEKQHKLECSVLLNDKSTSLKCNWMSGQKNQSPLSPLPALVHEGRVVHLSETNTVPLSGINVPAQILPSQCTLTVEAPSDKESMVYLYEASSPQYYNVSKASEKTGCVLVPLEACADILLPMQGLPSHLTTQKTNHTPPDKEYAVAPHEAILRSSPLNNSTPQQDLCNSLLHTDYSLCSSIIEHTLKEPSSEPTCSEQLQKMSETKTDFQPRNLKCVHSFIKGNVAFWDMTNATLKQTVSSDAAETASNTDRLSCSETCWRGQQFSPNELPTSSFLRSRNQTEPNSSIDFREQSSNGVIQLGKCGTSELSFQQAAKSANSFFKPHNLDLVDVPTICTDEYVSPFESNCPLAFQHDSINTEPKICEMMVKDPQDSVKETSLMSDKTHRSLDCSLSVSEATVFEANVNSNSDLANTPKVGWMTCGAAVEKRLLPCSKRKKEIEKSKDENDIPEIQPREKDTYETLTDDADTSTIEPCVKRNKKRKYCHPQFHQADDQTCGVTDKPVLGDSTELKKRNAKGETRLHQAVRKGDLALVKTLITAGISVNQKDHAGWTAIHEASSKGFCEVISELLKVGADVNSRSLDGSMPIYDAVSGNHFKAAEILLRHGANPNTSDKFGKSVLDETMDENMRELLRSYCCAPEAGAVCRQPEDSTEVQCVQSRSLAPEVQKEPELPSATHPYATREKTGTHQTVICILQDIDERQKKLFCLDLLTPKDADISIQEMTQIQDVLNDVLNKQKTERDVLAKKYRASIDSFKQGKLREELAKMATRQRNLLNVVQKQKELGQKLKEYQNKRKRCAGAVNRLLAISEEPHEELGQLQDGPLTEVITEDEINENSNSGNLMLYENIVSDSSSESILQSKSLAETRKDNCASNRDPSEAERENSRQEINDNVKVIREDHKQNVTLKNRTLHISDARILVPSAGQNSKKKANMDEISLLQSTKHLATAEAPRCPSLENNVSQKAISPHSSPSQTGQVIVIPTECMSHTPKIANPQPCNKKQTFTRGKQRQMKMVDLIKLGRIQPGTDVLEFKVQDSSHKATLLLDGRIRINSGRIYTNPIQWIKTLLGEDISVSWKYAMSKVSYLGKELSSYISSGACSSEESVSPSQQNKTPDPSSLPLPASKSCHFLELNEVLLITDQEFLPCHIMDLHWKYYLQCEDFAF
ncbi:ankyrin repeat domain-containing protein 31 isoform X2 [Lissotriton helveticus]